MDDDDVTEYEFEIDGVKLVLVQSKDGFSFEVWDGETAIEMRAVERDLEQIHSTLGYILGL